MDGIIAIGKAKKDIASALTGVASMVVGADKQSIVVTTNDGATFKLNIPNPVDDPDLINRISVNSEGNVCLDGEELAWKKDIPVKVSDLENDSNFVTNSKMLKAIANAQLGNGEDSDIVLNVYQPIEESTLTTTAKTIPTAINELKSGLDDKVNKTDITTTIDSSSTDTQIPSAKATYDLANTKANTNHTHNTSDIKGLSIPTKVSDLANDKNYISSIPSEYVTETELTAKKYLTSVPSTYALKTDIPTVPTKTSQLTNDSKFITSIPAEYITETELNAKGYLTSHQDISGLQTKTDNNLTTTSKEVVGAINELKTGISSISVLTQVSQLTNDSGYLSTEDITTTINSTSADTQIPSAKAVYEKMSSIMSANGNSYSLDEQLTGGTWIDGKPIYRKTVNFGALPDSTKKHVAHGVNNIGWVIDMYGSASVDSSYAFITLPFPTPTATHIATMSCDKTSVIIETTANLSTYKESYITIEYTKTTD